MRSGHSAARWMGLVALAIYCALPAYATEVVVKNDSLQDYGQAYIVGDFIMGEMAGARLASPCDGSIVAVQILWWEAPGAGNPPSLEEAIRIYSDGPFPLPGNELALLEGPVLEAGALNEFRYIDENQSIPLDIPVLADEQFTVALEFYNPTDVGNGGASVVRDVNGCQWGHNVLYALPGGWLDFCVFLQGDLVIRAVIDCPGPTGACCYVDGTCDNGVEIDDCEAEPGAVWHEGQTCDEIDCVAVGACCNGAGGCLPLQTEDYCENTLGSIWAGAGTACGACSLGACCLPDGTCLVNLEIECADLGGTFEGADTTCDPNPCPQPTGACCVGTSCVPNQLEADCTGFGGTWQGAFSTCDPDPCAGPAVCRGDSNCDTRVDWRDIDFFVAAQNDDEQAWHDLHVAAYGVAPACPFDNNDANEDGTVSWRDIDPFVARQNTSCP